jgi:hypothetical protein
MKTDAVEDDADLVIGSKEHLLLEHFRTPTVEATVAVAEVRRRGRWAVRGQFYSVPHHFA